MESRIETVRELFRAFDTADEERLCRLTTSDFKLEGRSEQPFDRPGLVAMSKMMRQAFDPLTNTLRSMSLEGDSVIFWKQLEGTHCGVFAPAGGIEPIEPTGRLVRTPFERYEARFDGDRVSALIARQHPDGGLPGILACLGARQDEPEIEAAPSPEHRGSRQEGSADGQQSGHDS